ncbi:MAG: hypothetical protein A2504_11770 [Bdellovibrionales bacterium RIFOXYD12_FULL_39_22]|nr:MAG: hypothetical protein A2385_16285 [Bdellovibrionales bacterium RIFOXYB1_FULL_39_21]OFZ44484.1 MAG: hypothetical protein A2485_06610 [Bdellovibrionales bacterium RIFOXYC12_FULL_39_17]OFZ49874.1 MAG: hypothetical protein A2404_00855 [Bdellovibrionales bacterium RIFOXYC1_FULL_39_130]OFZ71189.1 MAG: hypothetical protein A2451_02660 [Bdellovibrionales bacterium RIFOXYC2_FULL_39_8]OFZ76879.1 MAG: hypothetical protein A2560_05655 [Bdellovibrionales bacterium RIFOXYD1_FULL_39_84]OFZ95806.1 MAG:
MQKIEDVRTFWDTNPLFTGESKYKQGSVEFFEEHRAICIDDCFAGKMNTKLFPNIRVKEPKILDLGCGIGFWLIEIARKYESATLFAGDLSSNSLEIAQKRCNLFKVYANFSVQNAESMTYNNHSFDHINCQGVVHHTPNTEMALAEIARVLKPGGTASISVYYKNFFLRNWNIFFKIFTILHKFGFGLNGRGRENIYAISNSDEIVRLYDGAKNPIGKSYTKKEFLAMLTPYFEIIDVFYHFFPARSFPIKIPNKLHRILELLFPFMIYVSVKKLYRN